jgi:hypothetical protein
MFNNTILGLIYIIKHKTCDDKKVYVGSTNDLKRRISQHRHSCNNKKRKNYNYKLYQYIRENGGINEYQFIILECYVCNHNHELYYKEDDYIKMYDNNLNSKRAYLTDEEYKNRYSEIKKKYKDENKEQLNEYSKKYYYENKDKFKKYRDDNKDKYKKYREDNKEKHKNWYENNKEELNEYSKKYHEEHREIINEKRKEKIICECGRIVRKDTITTHRKSLKHIAFIEQKNNVIL